MTFVGFDPKCWNEPKARWHIDRFQFDHHINSPNQGLLPIPIFSDIESDCGDTAISIESHKVMAHILQKSEPDDPSSEELSQAVRLLEIGV